MRLGGVTALVRLADEWEQQRTMCIDVLCAYLRMPFDPDDETTKGESEVRLTIIRSIKEHLVKDPVVSWHGHRFDFTGTRFYGGDFAGIVVPTGTDLVFRDVHFSGGEVWFGEAKFSGGEVWFDEAKFSGGTVSFDRATFSGSTVSFDGAEFLSRRVDFSKAIFETVPSGLPDHDTDVVKLPGGQLLKQDTEDDNREETSDGDDQPGQPDHDDPEEGPSES